MKVWDVGMFSEDWWAEMKYSPNEIIVFSKLGVKKKANPQSPQLSEAWYARHLLKITLKMKNMNICSNYELIVYKSLVCH